MTVVDYIMEGGSNKEIRMDAWNRVYVQIIDLESIARQKMMN